MYILNMGDSSGYIAVDAQEAAQLDTRRLCTSHLFARLQWPRLDPYSLHPDTEAGGSYTYPPRSSSSRPSLDYVLSLCVPTLRLTFQVHTRSGWQLHRSAAFVVEPAVARLRSFSVRPDPTPHVSSPQPDTEAGGSYMYPSLSLSSRPSFNYVPFPPSLADTWARLRTWLGREYPELGDTLNYRITGPEPAALKMLVVLASG
jgi:hypothetical protein